jgi:hypothetical protein
VHTPELSVKSALDLKGLVEKFLDAWLVETVTSVARFEKGE